MPGPVAVMASKGTAPTDMSSAFESPMMFSDSRFPPRPLCDGCDGYDGYNGYNGYNGYDGCDGYGGYGGYDGYDE